MLEIGKEYTGNNFNLLHKGIKLYKFLNNDLKHYNFTYQLGLNIDFLPFNPDYECSPGGLYFCDENTYHCHFNGYGHKIALIEIPDDARIYVEENKFKADKLIITDIIDFSDIGDDFWINILSIHGCVLKYIKTQTPAICALAVYQNGLALTYVDDQTPVICELAVQQNGLALSYVDTDKQTLELCILAVKQNKDAIHYVNAQYLPELDKQLFMEI